MLLLAASHKVCLLSRLVVLWLLLVDIVRITAGALPRGLHVLNLSKNKISTIEGLRELTRLRSLDLSYNKISRIGHGKDLIDTTAYHFLRFHCDR